MPQEIATEQFASALDWEAWLSQNLDRREGIWMRFAKKGSGVTTVSYDEALDVALCYGWIDGQKRAQDAEFFLLKFTPRRARSLWSKRNVEKVMGLIESGRMRPAGLAEVAAAQGDGRWEAAYASQREMVVPEDFLAALEGGTQATFEGLSRASRYAIAFRLHNARTSETRARRFAALLEMLARGEGPR